MRVSKTKLNKYALLRHKKYRDKEGLFMVQGEKAVADTLGKFELESILTSNPTKYIQFSLKYPMQELSEPEVRKISTLEKLPDIIAIYKKPDPTYDLKADKNKFTLVLDGIQDPGNLGTIIRTAHWFGIKKIFCSIETVDVYNPKVVMATMGSIASVEVIYCNLEDLFENNPDYPVYGLLLEGENIFSIGKITPGFIVMGSEGHGPTINTSKRISRAFTIPAADPSDSPDSLNVAVATAITISQLVK